MKYVYPRMFMYAEVDSGVVYLSMLLAPEYRNILGCTYPIICIFVLYTSKFVHFITFLTLILENR